MLNLAGKGAIVAGTRRVGAAVVERLAAEGCNIAIVYRRSAAEAEALRDKLRDKVERITVIQADLSIEEDVKRAVAEAESQLGNLSFCVNLASDYPRVPLAQLDGDAWDHGLSAAKGVYLLALHAGRAMMKNPGPTRGHHIFFGDWAAEETPYIDFLPYLSAKAAVHFMTRAFALEFAPWGILVNGILPGPTARAGQVSDVEWEEALADSPLHRESSDAEMAEIVATLLKLETITGENIRVDSGRHISGSGRPQPEVRN